MYCTAIVSPQVHDWLHVSGLRALCVAQLLSIIHQLLTKLTKQISHPHKSSLNCFSLFTSWIPACPFAKWVYS